MGVQLYIIYRCLHTPPCKHVHTLCGEALRLRLAHT
nr:MAG TPA: hypothetical protein [Caudoviricetes sp.]